MRVKDIMTKDVVSVEPDTNVIEVARILHETNYTGLPVTDQNKKVVGVITEDDLLANDSYGTHIPSFAKLISDFHMLGSVKGEEKKNLELIVHANAESVMEKNFFSVHPEAILNELMTIFNEKHANPVPVVDDGGVLQGIVSRADIVKLVSKFSEAELDFLRDI